ncbi:MAG: NifU family protein [Solirubrobacteraceae bacterium]|nr:NifU family protein [Solirubrobacteraceae bacterium]
MEFDAAVAQLATLVETLEREGDDRALLLLGLMDDIHRPALELIVEGQPDHPVALALLSMYGLAPIDERIEAEEALDEIRPYIEGHGGELELVDVQDGVISVRMSGACNGCAASAMTLRRGIEGKLRERLDWFKEVVALEPEGGAAEPHEAPASLPLLHIEPLSQQGATNGATTTELLQIEKLRRPVFVEVGTFDDLAEGTLKAVDVDGRSVLIHKLDGEPYAFVNVCPNAGARLPLDGAKLSGSVIVCPWHNCAYDARSGKRVDDEPGPALAVLPIAVIDGTLQVAANVA